MTPGRWLRWLLRVRMWRDLIDCRQRAAQHTHSHLGSGMSRRRHGARDRAISQCRPSTVSRNASLAIHGTARTALPTEALGGNLPIPSLLVVAWRHLAIPRHLAVAWRHLTVAADSCENQEHAESDTSFHARGLWPTRTQDAGHSLHSPAASAHTQVASAHSQMAVDLAAELAQVAGQVAAQA